jgi:hypothetical protein
MKKNLFTMFLLLTISQFAFSQPNSFISNTATSFTLNSPCAPVFNGTYTVQLNYFDFTIGDWVPGPNSTVLQSYSGVVVTVNNSTGDVVYDFSAASPAANFPVGLMAESQGWIKVPSTGAQMNWDNHQINCPALPLTLISFTATKQSGCSVLIQFETADEYDMTDLIIERSSNGTNVINMPIAHLAPHNDGLNHTYSFTDNYPYNGINYYRLRLLGLSGYVKYSDTKSAQAPGCTAQPAAANCSTVAIGGPSSICSYIGNYYVTNQPNYTVNNWSWSSNNYGATLSDTYGPTTRVTKSSWGFDGQVQLQSYMTGCQAGTQYRYKSISLGIGEPPTGYFYPNYEMFSHELYRETYGDNHLGQGGYNSVMLNSAGAQTWEESAQSTEYGTQITWSYSPGGFLSITMPPYGHGWILFKVTIATSCGPAEYYYDFWSADSYRLSPNPATSEVIISTPGNGKSGTPLPGRLRNKTLFNKDIRQVIIVDRAGHIVMHRAYGEETKQVKLNTSSLKPDFYIARIFNGKTWEVMKFIKK